MTFRRLTAFDIITKRRYEHFLLFTHSKITKVSTLALNVSHSKWRDSISKPLAKYVLYYSSKCYVTPLYDVSYATSRNIKGPYKKFGGLIQTGTYGLIAPGGLDMAINGDHAVFHANWNGGRAMFTALIRGQGSNLQVFVKNN